MRPNGSDWHELRSNRPSAAAELTRLSKTERTMVVIRWAGVVFGLVQTLTFYLPYPPGVLPWALGLVGCLATGNVAVMWAQRRAKSLAKARRLSLNAFVLDCLTILGFSFVYTFDEATSIWALIYIIPLEGAIRFGLRGAIISMAASTLIYVVREAYGTATFGNEFLPTSISFRMGLGFLVAGVAGGMSSNLAKERRELETANSKYHTLLDALGRLGEGLVVAEPDRILFANQGMEDILGYSEEELMSLPDLMHVVAPESQPEIASRIAEMDSEAADVKDGDRLEVVALDKSGAKVHLEVAFKPIDASDQFRVLAVVRDVTKRRAAEEDVSAALVREREAVRRLEALDAARSDFLSTVSHELRTPVTTIGGFAHTLIQRWDMLKDNQRVDFVRRISVGAAHLNRLIAELLDFTRLERAESVLDLRDVHVDDALLDALEQASPMLEEHWISCDVEPGLEMIADQHAFGRIVENLLTNAAKFSPAGTTIRIKARGIANNEILFEVTDEGMGVPSEDTAKVFERFYRVQRGDTSPSGTGIGLAVVKEFVQAHGGKVWVRPSDPGGSSFAFTLKAPVLRSSLKADGMASSLG